MPPEDPSFEEILGTAAPQGGKPKEDPSVEEILGMTTDSADYGGFARQAADTAIKGLLPYAEHPGMPGRQATPIDKRIIAEQAGARLSRAVGPPFERSFVSRTTDQVARTTSMEQAYPKVAAKVTPPGGTAYTRAMDAMKFAGKTGYTALDFVGSQADRLRNSVMSAIDAGIKHKDYVKAFERGGTYGTDTDAWKWHPDNEARKDFDEVLAYMGYGEGPNLGPAIARGLAMGSTLGLSELGPALGMKKPDFDAYAPEIRGRKVMGFVGDMLLDPLTWATMGVGNAIRLVKSGRYLNKIGASALELVQKMHWLEETPETMEWLIKNGSPQTITKIQDATRALGMIDKGNLKSVTGAKGVIDEAWKAIQEEIGVTIKAGRGDEIPWLGGSRKTADEKVRESAEASMEALMNKYGTSMEERGGLKIAGKTVIPGKPVTEAAGKFIQGIGGKMGAGLRKAGKILDERGMHEFGPRVRDLPDDLTKVVDAVGGHLSNAWKLPKHFVLMMNSKYRGALKAAEIAVIDAVRDATWPLRYGERIDLAKTIDASHVIGNDSALHKWINLLEPDRAAIRQEAYNKVKKLHDDTFNMEYSRGLIHPEQYDEFYLYHYYHNQKAAANHPMFADKTIYNPKDPSTYQRVIDSLEAAEKAGLNPEYDIEKLLAMRLLNAHRSVITHDFMAATVASFGKWIAPVKGMKTASTRGAVTPKLEAAAHVEDDIVNAVRMAGGSRNKPPTMLEMIARGHVDVTDPDNYPAIADRLVGDRVRSGQITRLPDDLKREFLRQKFLSVAAPEAGARKAEQDIMKEFSAYRNLWPGGGGKGSPVQHALGLTSLPGDGPYIYKEIRGMGWAYLPTRIAEKLHEIQNSQEWTHFSNILSIYDKVFQNRIRMWATAPRVAFHTRNAISNAVMSAMDVGIEAINPAARADSIAILRGVKDHVITRRDGSKYSALEVKKLFRDSGGWNLFHRRAHINYDSAEMAISKEIGAAELTPKHAISPFYWGTRLGNDIENDARIMHFTALWKDGLTPAQAIERTHKYLFDYSDLTQFEKQFMRRLTLFYTWPRKALPVIAETAVTNPKHFTGYARLINMMSKDGDSPDKMVVEKQLMSEYMRMQYGLRIGPLSEEGAIAAKNYVNQSIPAGTKVQLRQDSRQATRDKYGRMLSFVYGPDGAMLNPKVAAQHFGMTEDHFMGDTDDTFAGPPITGTVTSTYDGDTIHVQMPDGKIEKIRFLGINTPEINVPQLVRWFTGADLPQQELNSLWAGDLNKTWQHLVEQVGPAPELFQALLTVTGEGLGLRNPTDRAKDVSKSFALLKTLQGTWLGDWLGVYQKRNPYTQKLEVMADKKKVKFLTGIIGFEPFLRDIDRFASDDDSVYTALARMLTGGSFQDADPQLKLTMRTMGAMKYAGEAAKQEEEQLKFELIRGGHLAPEGQGDVDSDGTERGYQGPGEDIDPVFPDGGE